MEKLKYQTQEQNDPKPDSEDLYLQFIELSPDTICIHSNQKIIYINKAGADLLGAPNPNYLIGKSILDFLHPQYQDKIDDFLRQMYEQREILQLTELIFINLQGENINVEASSTPIVYQGKPAVQCLIRDISQRKMMEQSLNFRLEFEKIITGISTKFITLPMEEINQGINEALKNIGEFMGVDRCYVFQFSDGVTTASNSHEWCAEGVEPQIENLQSVPVDMMPWWMEKFYRFKDVFIPSVKNLPPEAQSEKETLQAQSIKSLVAIPMIDGNTLMGFIGFDLVRDKKIFKKEDIVLLRIVGEIISNAIIKKRMEEALRQSKELFYKAFNASPNPSVIIKVINESYLEVNDSFVQLSGYERHEVIGHKVTEIDIWANPEDRACMLELLSKQGFVNNREVTLRKKSGGLCEGLLSAQLISINKEPCILVVGNDISELKKFEREILRLDRLNLIGEIAAGIGHEVRNPMTTVRGFLQLLENKDRCSEYKHYFNLMIEELDRANLIITQFLSLAKYNPFNAELLDLNQIIEKIYPLIQAEALKTDKQVEIKLNNIPYITLDEKGIRQVVLNLVKNGLDAMKSGGVVKIKTSSEGNEIILSVSDQGSGIKQSILKQLGTPFVTTKASGTGIGLAVCFKIIEMHNAIVDYDSSPKGTTFYLRFKVK